MENNSYMSLNGQWETGKNRIYDRSVCVPGLVSNPKLMNDATLWYKKTVVLPEGEWTYATLVLKGARFCPSIYVNGRLVSRCGGGMAPTMHLLDSPEVMPGKIAELEISLKPLGEMDIEDASRISKADWWRSNISSCLWDDVIMKFHKGFRINRLIPYPDIANGMISVRWEIEKLGNTSQEDRQFMLLQILDKNGRVMNEVTTDNVGCNGNAVIDTSGCKLWSPETPNCYTLKASLKNNKEILDIDQMTLGIKEFKAEGLGFTLNHKPVVLRAGTVVWHRWLRDPESGTLAFDEKWFETNVVLRLKSHGANALRFHLGMPPEKFLDLCDRHGVIVQAEWSFFHGMKGSVGSLIEQWRSWIDICMRHPSIAIIHAWNETDEEELEAAYKALEILSQEYPPLVFGHRDVIHYHKYWWGTFENIGLYYDSPEQFDKPVMVDEFGGNYMDGEGEPGDYPLVIKGFLRFLGRNHTMEMRLQLQCDSNGKIAEYWRRIGVAGFSPFCILGSREDGNHHFMGRLEEGNPKPVWEALTAAYSPISCSLNTWDCNYTPGRKITLQVYLFNDTENERELNVSVKVTGLDNTSVIKFHSEFLVVLKAYGTRVRDVEIQLPDESGNWQTKAELVNKPETILHPVVSAWRIRTMRVKVPHELMVKKIAVPPWERELASFIAEHQLRVYDPEEENIDVLLTSRTTFNIIIENPTLKQAYKKLLEKGCSIVMLEVGPRDMGSAYLSENKSQFDRDAIVETELFCGVKTIFRYVGEPESYIHPSEYKSCLWEGIDPQATWIWNGLRGGLIVPDWDMEIYGQGMEDFLSQWVSRGADASKMLQEDYFAYELAGFYAFSIKKDVKIMDELRTKVKFLREDAPALKVAINADGPIHIIDLSDAYRQSKNNRFKSTKPLVSCGRDLLRTPVLEVVLEKCYGKLILSQLITEGRLAEGFGQEGFYGIRKDPAAGQFVLNLIKQAL